MDAKQVLEQVRSGAISVEDAEQFFRRAPYEELGYAKLDTHRKLRSGFGEVVFCSGKADEFLSDKSAMRQTTVQIPTKTTKFGQSLMKLQEYIPAL